MVCAAVNHSDTRYASVTGSCAGFVSFSCYEVKWPFCDTLCDTNSSLFKIKYIFLRDVFQPCITVHTDNLCFEALNNDQ